MTLCPLQFKNKEGISLGIDLHDPRCDACIPYWAIDEKLLKIRNILSDSVHNLPPKLYQLLIFPSLNANRDLVSTVYGRVTKRSNLTREQKENDENLRFVEEPIEIVERDVKKLKRRRIPLVKVRWNSRQGAEYTWEREDQFKTKYPHLFAPTSSAVAS
ncbi:hypothetical protein Tco_0339736 [Tanacetum coccineum]